MQFLEAWKLLQNKLITILILVARCNWVLFDFTDLPCFDVWNIETEERGITIYYKVLECSPNLNKIKWMKNGETLVLRNKKYFGGGLKDGFITITSPTIADRGTYSCTVTNAVGSVSKRVTLGTYIFISYL